jgi:hypothetical protein
VAVDISKKKLFKIVKNTSKQMYAKEWSHSNYAIMPYKIQKKKYVIKYKSKLTWPELPKQPSTIAILRAFASLLTVKTIVTLYKFNSKYFSALHRNE